MCVACRAAVLAPLFLLSASAARAGLDARSPADGAEVPLLGEAQRAYLAKPTDARHAEMRDAKARRRLADRGDRPLAVTLAWSDSASPTGAVYDVMLKAKDSAAETFVVSNATELALVNFEAGRKYAWRVSRRGEPSAAAKPRTFRTAAQTPRLVLIPGVANVRDLGGYAAADGRRVRQGLVYRTSAFNDGSRKTGGSFLDARYEPGRVRITPAGRRELCGKLGVKTDLDLRTAVECAGLGGSPLGSDVRFVHVPLRAYEWLENDRPALARAFATFAEAKNYPIAFHCAGGRDRAGSLAFVLSALLGVGEDDLRRDWEASIFASDDLQIVPDRFDAMMTWLSKYEGRDVGEKVRTFVLSCGVTDDQIAAFRKIMLEPEAGR